MSERQHIESDNMIITVVIMNQYGMERIFPACEKSRLFCHIAGSKSLPRRTINYIKELGYTVKVAHEVTTL